MLTILWWALVALCLCFGFLGCFINKVPGPIAVVIATLLVYTILSQLKEVCFLTKRQKYDRIHINKRGILYGNDAI